MRIQQEEIITQLKICLKEQKITYADLAEKLSLSEASIKRIFSQCDLMLSRLDKICEILGMRISELMSRVESASIRLEQLSLEQEDFISSDIKLLLITQLVINGWTISDILKVYNFNYHELIKKIVQLDKIGVIELLTNDKIRTNISSTFSWHKNGPIEQFFNNEVRAEYFNGPFNKALDHNYFLSGMLSTNSMAQIQTYYEDLLKKIKFQIKQDKKLPIENRTGIAFSLLARDWEYSGFSQFRRTEHKKP